MADAWFEIVALAQQRARRRLPKPVYAGVLAASEKGVTAADNVVPPGFTRRLGVSTDPGS